MAHSKNRTTLAVLRSHLGPLGGEHELSSIIGRSASWVNKVSAGRIHMTRDAALRISMETGVCPEWLLRNDPAESAVAVESGVRFDNAFFKRYRDNLASTKPTMVDPLIQISSEALPSFVLCVARHFQAVRSSHGEVKRLSEWLRNAAHILENEFPVAERRDTPELERAALELCRLTARAWAPRRKGYKRATGKAKSSASMEDTEYLSESISEQRVQIEHRRLSV